MAGEHRCAAVGCPAMIGTHLLMCPTHWRMVPADAQAEVRASYDERMQGENPARLHPRHARACVLARLAVAEREGQREVAAALQHVVDSYKRKGTT
jgi:hypothetical protein